MSSSNEQNIPQLPETNHVRDTALLVMKNLKSEIDLLRSHKSNINRLVQMVKEDKPVFLMEALVHNENVLRETRTKLNLWIQQHALTRVKPQLAEEVVEELVEANEDSKPAEAVRQMMMQDDPEQRLMWQIEDDVMALASEEFSHNKSSKDIVELNFEFDLLLGKVAELRSQYWMNEFVDCINSAYFGMQCFYPCNCRPGCLPNV